MTEQTQLPEGIINRIEKNSEEYVTRWGRTYNGFKVGEVRKNDFKSGAISEALRSQKLVRALEQVEESYGDHSLIRTIVADAINEYNSTP